MEAVGRVLLWRVALRALLYRPTQAVAVVLLSTVGIGACVFAPLYERSVGQAQLRQTLTSAPASARGVALTSTRVGSDPMVALAAGLDRGLYGDPVRSIQTSVQYPVGDHNVAGLVASRVGQCGHLRLDAGRCPASASEAMASSSAARVLGLRVGSTVVVSATLGGYKDVRLSMRVVGLYRPFDSGDGYWFDHRYSSAVGAFEAGSHYQADALLAGEGFAAALQGEIQGPFTLLPVANTVELPLRLDRVGLTETATLRRGLAETAALAEANGVRLDGGLPSLLDQIGTAQRQAGTIIPGFAFELALLLLVLTAIVMVAAAEQRQPDVALARLRGRSHRQSAGVLIRELAPVVMLSVLPGVGLGWGLGILANRLWLAGHGGPEWRWPPLAAAAAVLLVELSIVVVVARRAARRPVHDLLLRVPRQPSRRGVGVLEAAIAALALAGVIVVVSGDQHNLLAVLTPGFIALIIGLIASRILVVLARRVGSRALWAGRLATGLALLQFTRRLGARRVVVLVCIATALIVSALDQASVAARNRVVRASVDAGAAVVLTVQAKDAATLRGAVAAADPGRGFATPVVTQRPANGLATMAIDPQSFARIGSWGWPGDAPSAAALRALSPRLPPPVTVTGTSIQLTLSGASLTRRHDPQVGGVAAPVLLWLELHPTDGPIVYASLGPLPEGTATGVKTLRDSVACASGCRLARISLHRGLSDTDSVHLELPITDLSAGAPGALRPVSLGVASDWAPATPRAESPDAPAQFIELRHTGAGLVISASNAASPAVLQQLSTPLVLPALLAGPLRSSTNQLGYLDASNIGGLSGSFTQVGTLRLGPGPDRPGLIVDLALAEQLASAPDAGTVSAVWLASADPARERSLIDSLAHHGVTVLSRDTRAAHLGGFDAAAPAQALRLAPVTALLAAALAVLVMIMSAATSQRGRAADLAALRLLGVGAGRLRRASILEQVGAASVATVLGAGVGVIGAQLALRSIPIFISPVDVPAVLHPVGWSSVLETAAAMAALLIATAVAIGYALMRRVGAGPGQQEQR